MSVLVDLDFTKETLSKTILDFFRNGLQGNPDQSGSKQTYEECLRTLSQGKKLQYGAANYLLLGIVRSLGIGNSQPDDEFLPGERQDDKELGIDPTMSQIMADASSQKKKTDMTQKQDDTIHGSEEGASGSKLANSGDEARNDKSDRSETLDKTNKKRETCRYFARGHCTRAKECRFDHPKVCSTFREHGSLSTSKKGCDGKCNAFHPNACRRSLKDKTCSFPDCRFFHLKGTKRPPTNQGTNNSSSKNWRSNQNQNQKNQGQHNPTSNFDSKNRYAGLDTKKKNETRNQRKKQDSTQTGSKARQNPQNAKADMGTKTEQAQLAQTLEAIMKRLSAMETKQSSYPLFHPVLQAQPTQPLLSPAVPQPGTQTHYQWASQPPWTQTQTQY